MYKKPVVHLSNRLVNHGLAAYRVEEIDPSFYVLRVDDEYAKFFEALWEIPEGITYNAYLLKTREGAVLFDGWKKPFSGMLIDVLETLIRPDDLKYVIVNHMEPDHSGSLEDVVRWASGITVLGHPIAGKMMKAYPRASSRFKPVKDGEALSLGGEEIRFIHTPWLHWPETMMSWLENRGILVTCDAFGGYGIPGGLYDDECQNWGYAQRAIQKYVVTVIGHYKEWITKNLEKISKLGIRPKMIAPAHGLIWKNPSKIIEVYSKLGRAEPAKGKILIVYGSMYGTVEKLVKSITSKLVRNGYQPVTYGYTDTKHPSLSEILTDAIDAEVIIIAAPTYEADVFPLVKFAAEELCWKIGGGKKAIVVSSYGWGSVAAKHLKKTLEACGFNVIETLEYNSISPMAISHSETEKISEQIFETIKE
jgi:flavorubredoxin